MARLKFGTFIAPVHKPGINPTLAFEQDLQLVEHLDRLGYDEAWFGEHHSAGSELIGSPEIFIAAAAARTRQIKLGTGVTSIAYHNPLWVADRMVQLDHMTRGRVMLGVGPGSLPTDSAMIGLTPTQTREILEPNLDVILRLLAGETVTTQTITHNLIDAKLQLAPYSDPLFDITVAAVASPTGARLAGKYGLGMLSIGATLTADGFNALAHHWNIVEERAEANGQQVSREGWRLVGPFHIAETQEQAYKDVEYGIEHWFNYFEHVAAFPQMAVAGDNLREMIDFINGAGIGVIGTAEQARAQVQRLVDQSGGFGSMLLMGHDWANFEATKRSYEIFMREVAPHFQGQSQPTIDAAERATAVREDHAAAQMKAVEIMTAKYEDEKAHA
ncbi:MAG TPA: LLM class flavin-dependent oxidoreductase [Gordonia sp. (in: high G+C Gram-positive bacteria)]|uniref:LLM class flavin-dependent oxidoreductase n=1 Tax=unclassified Gordonia (in: high G+C Gram-positive bacteria) TaxID=2657482 RepID=UPI000FB054B6|nr:MULTISPECIES: LLM class flavin-dependent oxidoreductase [unclassified Gordonia (in: high G+C Gram-positive bacteria)]RUP39166.1 MAG: LLM class flavin-dependent oxidoreductase [Gordonia sp. (in: high G+C Gram-positive bacteria)]HNP56788.1 LLM class flavin-dependent oxidoreductase [Gordonia sp. (in: high G+C Gram-positive bacteria)]HRC49911.1 LLM class flavin-dependent oxidoreductase [Gordonia sp. (in: high G+C Gram-positive bacteria)]